MYDLEYKVSRRKEKPPSCANVHVAHVALKTIRANETRILARSKGKSKNGDNALQGYALGQGFTCILNV